MVFRIHVHIDTSPQIRFRNTEGNLIRKSYCFASLLSSVSMVHSFYVMTQIIISPFFCVMANPMNYMQKSGCPSVTSWRAVDYKKFM